ncbi:hypothetical protein BV25DRAFT_1816072 [Artomyces pyxidatus]|uniref:Uncharacterized protein n=1 Tax=Artomyces pyxidatus TaxID=48021 RepID=A0ACB8SF60_9AGAM|nr:hypothetical protein BV25DRAFT_1816072 [Artomyces pyxidatus]
MFIQASDSTEPSKASANGLYPYGHLAVLLPKHLWKRDVEAACCDNFLCREMFSFFQRRHHCRKCGGIFCSACSDYTLPLLDTTNLPFIHPPRGSSLEAFASANASLVPCRICRGCRDQIRGIPFQRSPSTSLIRTSVDEPTPEAFASSKPRTPKQQRTGSLNVLSEPDHNVPEGLLLYPLRRPSVICKRTGGGRWMPRSIPVYSIPGKKAPHEVWLELEQQQDRMRQENPVLKDGEIMTRRPQGRDQTVPGPWEYATF